MPKEPSRPAAEPHPQQPASLKPGVRRQIGESLRGLYAETLSAPVGRRLEDLLAELDRPKR